MEIAVLGWGSLIWDPGNLCIKDNWSKDGPFLPIEFSRISRDGRLTLVLCPKANKVQVLWAIMCTDILERAIDELKEREGTNRKNIGFVNLNSSTHQVILKLLN